MKKLNTKDIKIIPTTGETENSAIRFETKDGKPAAWYDDGEDIKAGFYTDEDFVDDDATEFDGFYGEDEETWEAAVNDCLAGFGVKLGEHHGWTPQADEYYDVEAI